MAYLSFAPWDAGSGPAVRRPAAMAPATAADANRFSALELRVIGLAEQGAPARRDGGGRLARLIQWAFGVEERKPLADPRLESLRRFASQAWHRPDSVSDGDIRRLVEAGYSPGQAYGLIAYLSARRGHSPGLA